MRLRSILPLNASYEIALFRQSWELLRIVLPMTLTVPVAVTGSRGESSPTGGGHDPRAWFGHARKNLPRRGPARPAAEEWRNAGKAWSS
jgi:hypothetical protein